MCVCVYAVCARVCVRGVGAVCVYDFIGTCDQLHESESVDGNEWMVSEWH